MRVFLAKATGVIGICLLELLGHAGHGAAGRTRSPDKASAIPFFGAVPVVYDATVNRERGSSPICGGGERTRTADFYVANVALYQLSYTPALREGPRHSHASGLAASGWPWSAPPAEACQPGAKPPRRSRGRQGSGAR